MKTTWLANIAKWIAVSFEELSPALFKLLAAILPYTTPFPVAWLTAANAEQFLDFSPTPAFLFVFSLEGIGLWFTSLFVDSVIDWIRSRNLKTFGLVIMFAAVVAAYVFILVNLNVTLDAQNNPNSSSSLSTVITLLCFLPMLTGVGNGYYKWKIEQKSTSIENRDYERNKEERVRQEKRQDSLKRKMIKQGMNPFEIQYQSDIPQVQKRKSDWRQLDNQEKHDVIYVLSVEEIMEKYDIGRSTAFGWKSKKV